MEKSKNLKEYFWVAFVFLGLFLLCTWRIIFAKGLISGLDWPIPPLREQVLRWFDHSFYAWTDSNTFTGQPQQALTIQLFPLFGFLALFSYLGISGEIISKTLLLIFFGLGGLSCFLLFRHFKFDFKSSLVGSLIYCLTSFSIDWILIGGIGEFLGLYAILPLSFYFFLKAIESRKRAVWWSILTVFSTLFYPLYSFVLQMILYLSFSLFEIIVNRRDLKNYLRFFLWYIPIYFLVNSYWLLLVISAPSQAMGGINLNLSIGEYFKSSETLRLWSKLAPLFELSVNEGFVLIRVTRRCLSFGLPILAFLGMLLAWKKLLARYAGSLIILVFGFLIFPPTYHLIEKNILFFAFFAM